MTEEDSSLVEESASTAPLPPVAELQTAADSFRTICENAPVMIDQFTADGRCILWNRECEKQLGYSEAEVKACRDPLALFYPDEGLRQRVLHAIQSADGSFREFRVRAKDGSERIQLWADLRLPDGAQISVGHDVTEQRATEAQLRQSQKMEALGQLTGGMAHDFNNVLAVILTNADLLQRSPGLTEEGLARVEEIVAASTRGAAMVRKLLAFGRSEVMELTPLDANALISELAPVLTRLLPDGIRLRVQTEPSLPRVQADHGAVEQALFNLVTNARDAMENCGVLTISVEQRRLDAEQAVALQMAPGDHIAIAVSDDGAGMDVATQRRIFEPFFTTKGGEGTGLGMPMVYGLMKQQHGSVMVESKVGVGTTVTLLFPLDDVERTSAPVSSEHVGRILLVEDHAPLRRASCLMLESDGYHVETAPNGLVALALLEKDHDFDLVVCDLAMPQMGGAELYAAVGKLPTTPPFLFLTAYADDSVIAELAQDDTVSIIRKAYREEQLLGAVATLLGRASQRDGRAVPTS